MTRKLLHYKHGEHATRPICMPKIGSDIEILKRVRDRGSLTCKLSGWGVTDPTGTMPSPVLKEVALPWIDNEVLLQNNVINWTFGIFDYTVI